MKILITGGAGYIGSVTNSYLTGQGHETVIFDNLSTGFRKAVGSAKLEVGDLTQLSAIERVLAENKFDVVIHFAARALAGESMLDPYGYYDNNILGGLNLLEAMRRQGCNNIIFSSTCAVYGYPKTIPVSEQAAISPTSIYGHSKRVFEEILGWYEQVYGIKSVILRYFNACGAALDGSLGEYHMPETHIIPKAIFVATGVEKEFDLYGDDYQTPDGTCIRDYIHVLDLASAHSLAAEYLLTHKTSDIFNLGVGRGYSNLQVLNEIEKAVEKSIPRVVKQRRLGDPDAIFADNAKALKVLKWRPQNSDLPTIIGSAWKWHTRNPHGLA